MDKTAFGSSTTLHSFTPVRRRHSTINNLLIQGDQEQDWTATRCHRLLRALTSRVAILHKEFAHFSSTGQTGTERARENVRGKESAKGKATGEWSRTRNRIRQTYSKKSIRNKTEPHEIGQKARGLNTKGRKSLVPGEVAVSTPILARARGELPAGDPMTTIKPETEVLEEPKRRNKRTRTRLIANDESHVQLSESLSEQRKRIGAARYSTYEGIYSGLEALLRATAENKPAQRRKGPSSLLAMTLRAVPRYIAQQEDLLRVHDQETGSKSAIENRDISSEIYNELENFGSSGNGWHRLRVIVRSHGIQVVSDAIRAGLLDVEFSGSLISLCINTSALQEAQTLLIVLLNSTPYPRPKTPYDIPSRPLTMLWKFTEHTGRSSFQYKQLSDMVSNSILPVEWLATKEFGAVWTGVVHSLSPGSEKPDTLIFLDTSMAMLSRAGACSVGEKSGSITEAVRNTFSSLLAILSSVVILNRRAENIESIRGPKISRDYAHINTLLQSCLAQQSTNSGGRSPLVILANLMVQDAHGISAEHDHPLVSSLIRHLMRRDDDFASVSAVYASLVEFICRIALYCGRGTSTSGYEHFEYLHLLTESFIYDTEGGNVLHGLIVDSAFAFAQKLPDRQHLDYATLMDERFRARRFGCENTLVTSSTRDPEVASGGFRWEEGLGEWVSATPAINVSKTHALEAHSITDYENDTPLRPPPRLRRRKGSAIEGKSEVGLLSPPSNEMIVEPADSSELSLQTSRGLSDELDQATSISYCSSPRSVDELAARSHSISSTPSGYFYVDSHGHVSFISEKLSPTAKPPKIRSDIYCRPPRTPRLKRRLICGTQDLKFFDDSSLSFNLSVPGSSESSDSKEIQRNYINRAPRLGRRALRSSQAWQIFDESDDELSFLSVSSGGDQVLQDITNMTVSSARHLRQGNSPLIRQKLMVKQTAPHDESEDELCM